MNPKYRSNLLSECWSILTSTAYDYIIYKWEQRLLRDIRSRLIKPLEGQILDLGCGTGANFPYYNDACKVTAIDPSPHMLSVAKRKLAKYPFMADIKLHPLTIDQLVEEKLIPGEGFDAIVCTLVLCTVPNLEKTIAQCKELLHTDGLLIIIEHVQSRLSKRAQYQEWATPYWKRVAEGCHLNRPTDKILKAAGFQPLQERYYEGRIPFYEAILQIT